MVSSSFTAILILILLWGREKNTPPCKTFRKLKKTNLNNISPRDLASGRNERKSGPGAFWLNQTLITNQQKTKRRLVFRELVESFSLKNQTLPGTFAGVVVSLFTPGSGGGLTGKLEFSYNAALKKKQQI
jgi:hypothetical protein